MYYFVQHEVHNHQQHIIECLKESMNDIEFVCHVITPLAELTFFTIKYEKIKHWQQHRKCQNKKRMSPTLFNNFGILYLHFFSDVKMAALWSDSWNQNNFGQWNSLVSSTHAKLFLSSDFWMKEQIFLWSWVVVIIIHKNLPWTFHSKK